MNDERQAIDRTLTGAGLFVGMSLMFVPLVLVHRFHLQHADLTGQRGAEAAIGVAVILRTTFRRLLRAGSSNLLRTSVGAFSRTSARTMTRRVARTSTRLLLGLVARGAPDVDAAAPEPADEISPESPAETAMVTTKTGGSELALSALSTALGFAALAASFGWVATQAAASNTEGITALNAAGVMSPTELSFYAAVPLLCYVGVAVFVANRFGAGIRIRTAIDGLLLQGYFAGAGSFLPMTTDIEYVADEGTQSRIAFLVLLILYVMHLTLRIASAAVDSEQMLLFSALVLVYCFVYSFPIRPLEGYWIWNRSKLVWGVLWLPILVSFVATMPAAILNIL